MARRQCPYCNFYATWGGLALHISLKHPDKSGVITDED